MKNQDIHTSGIGTEKVFSTGPTTNRPDTFFDPSWSNVVTSGPIIKGNRRDPNGWSYTVTKKSMWRTFSDGWYRSRNRQDPPIYVEWAGALSNSQHARIPPWDMRTGVYNQALERLNSKVRGNLDLSVALAEAGKTAKMVKDLGKVFSYARNLRRNAIKEISMVRRGLRHNVSETSRHLANGYLQYRYGWKPLMSDVFDVADESIRIVLNKIDHFKAKAKVTMDGTDNTMRFIRAQPTVPVEVTGRGVQACTIGVSLTVPSFDPARWSSLNPVSIAWELIPYSFVVDWFYDVGSYLRNLETGLLYNSAFRTGYVSELFFYEAEERLEFYDTAHISNYDWQQYKKIRSSVTSIQFARNRLMSYPLPLRPSIRANLGSGQLLAGASLLRQVLSRI